MLFRKALNLTPTQPPDRIWLVSFMEYDPGFFNQDENRVEPVGNNPFTLKNESYQPQGVLVLPLELRFVDDMKPR